jgi:hypothetical protein
MNDELKEAYASSFITHHSAFIIYLGTGAPGLAMRIQWSVNL